MQEVAFTSVADIPVHYAAGWNLLAGPSGTAIDAAKMYGQFVNADGYVALADRSILGAGGTLLSGGFGYWAYFERDSDALLPGRSLVVVLANVEEAEEAPPLHLECHGHGSRTAEDDLEQHAAAGGIDIAEGH